MDIAVLLASLGISILELSEAGAVAVIFNGIYKNSKPYIYGLAGVLTVLIPVFTLGKYIVLLPLEYVLVVAGIILFYFGYRLIRSARRYFKGIKIAHKEEGEETLTTVYVVGFTEALEAGLVILALIPQSYISALTGTLLASIIVIALLFILKAQIMKIRVPHLKYVLSALLFSLGSLFFGEAFFNADEIYLGIFFVIYLGVNYIIIKI
ncbi:hypothetical protein [Acidianus sp. HS-5]|uniref:hypothetical protein n=1 Tax=Acidianus sp. HS-5 TaxID=2886040 RepID=UPI001F466A71|nr:hypothetical protein [Acidianus sp. HS-5]BDC17172.1 membrane protein [Acidianus sp. HS-5]